MKVPLAYGAYDRSIGAFPHLIQMNMVAERTPTQIETPLALIARPGLTFFASVGSGSLRGISRKNGLFDEAAVIVSGNEVYTLSTSASPVLQTGALETSMGRVQIALGRDPNGVSQARIVDGTRIYLTQNGTTTAENFPSGSETDGASSVAYIRQFWLAVKTSTAQVYYLVPGDTDWNALDFASAEYQPDPIVCIGILGEQIFLLGSSSTEVWALTGSTSPAIAPYGGLAWNVGCKARDTVVNVRNTLVWVSDRGEVVQSTGGEPMIISDHGLDEQIRQSDPTTLMAWTFTVDGHTYYVLSLEDQTWIYDMVTKLWSRASSRDYNYWRAGLGCDVSGNAYAADIRPGSNTIWSIAPDTMSDDGDEIIRTCTAFFEMRDGKLACGNISIVCSAGQGLQTGQGANPLVGMAYSDDYGQTFSDYEYISSGQVGQYNYRVRWNRKGSLHSPGRYFRFRCSDPVTFRMSDVRMNEIL